MRAWRMMQWCVTVTLAFAVVACARTQPATFQTPSALAAARVYPGEKWDSIADPRTVGWRRSTLDSVRAKLATMATTGMVAVVGGRVLMSYGNLDTVTYLASVRKSILSMLYGNYVKNGTVNLDKSLADLGMDDHGGLTAEEKQATVRDLLTARSGVYHAASNDGDDLASAPPRGSRKHGTYMLYSNWDFNAAGAAFEIQTKRDIYDALESDLARPIGMQDFDRARHRKTGDSTKSRYLAYHMNFSTRDMARLGYLALRHGSWNGRQLVPADWMAETTRPFTRVSEMNPERRRNGPFGYGYLWWVWDGAAATGAYEGAFTGQGAIGQYITILPKLDLVVAHKTSPGQRDAAGRPRQVGAEYYQALKILVDGYCGADCK